MIFPLSLPMSMEQNQRLVTVRGMTVASPFFFPLSLFPSTTKVSKVSPFSPLRPGPRLSFPPFLFSFDSFLGDRHPFIEQDKGPDAVVPPYFSSFSAGVGKSRRPPLDPVRRPPAPLFPSFTSDCLTSARISFGERAVLYFLNLFSMLLRSSLCARREG